jgi:hypothetical protein
MASLADRLRDQLPPSYVVTLAIFASMPLWTQRVGLYDYLALEILIWSLFAMSYNLMLGYTGLPSFGHGAYLGIGAYAFGLFQQNVALSLWGGLAAGDNHGCAKLGKITRDGRADAAVAAGDERDLAGEVVGTKSGCGHGVIRRE